MRRIGSCLTDRSTIQCHFFPRNVRWLLNEPVDRVRVFFSFRLDILKETCREIVQVQIGLGERETLVIESEIFFSFLFVIGDTVG